MNTPLAEAVAARELGRLVPPLLRFLKISGNPTVDVVFLDNGMLRQMKKAWLGKDVRFVDVLAFPEPKDFPHPESRRRALGEIYLNRAFLGKKRNQRHAMFIHGLLHLLGFGHSHVRDTIVMERREKQLLQRVTIRRNRFVFTPSTFARQKLRT